jgi:hypothetical protein
LKTPSPRKTSFPAVEASAQYVVLNQQPHPCKPGHDRLCWLIQKCVEKQSHIRCFEVRETKYIRLEKLTPMALEIDRRALTNRVKIDTAGEVLEALVRCIGVSDTTWKDIAKKNRMDEEKRVRWER